MAPVTARSIEKPPLSRHPAFVPIVALWLAALAGGSVAALPAGLTMHLVSRIGLALPPMLASDGTIAIGTALIGGALGLAAARAIASIQSRRARSEDFAGVAEASTAQAGHSEPEIAPLELDEELMEDAMDGDVSAAEPEAMPAPPSRHGKAVQLLRSRPTSELALPQLVERFAVALDDHLQHSRGYANAIAGGRHSDDLAVH